MCSLVNGQSVSPKTLVLPADVTLLVVFMLNVGSPKSDTMSVVFRVVTQLRTVLPFPQLRDIYNLAF